MRLILILVIMILTSCATNTTQQGSSTGTGTSTSTPTTQTHYALNAFEQPNTAANSKWVSSINRKVFNNQTTGFIVKGQPCDFVGDNAFKILPIVTKYPSAIEYKVGTYYDAMIPLTKDNCASADYVWLELSESYNKNGLTLTLEKNGSESLKPALPLLIQLQPYQFGMGISKGVYVNQSESWSLSSLDTLVNHRIEPMVSWVLEYSDNKDMFKQFVLDKAVQLTNVANNYTVITNKVSDVPEAKKPWVYLVDEPSDEYLTQHKAEYKALKAKLPNLPFMVTTTCRKDYPIDIYTVVFEQWNLVDESCYTGKRKWGYTACMANGCGENRAWANDPTKINHVDYHITGSPDLVIDAPFKNEFGFYMLGLKYKLEAILYYNSIEQWNLTKYGVDMFNDQYNYGGNGDGTLLYPDYENKSSFVSLRLKMLREASFMIDAAKLNGKESILTDKVKGPLSWDFTDDLRDAVYVK